MLEEMSMEQRAASRKALAWEPRRAAPAGDGESGGDEEENILIAVADIGGVVETPVEGLGGLAKGHAGGDGEVEGEEGCVSDGKKREGEEQAAPLLGKAVRALVVEI